LPLQLRRCYCTPLGNSPKQLQSNLQSLQRIRSFGQVRQPVPG
jgi:hypothetical protein